MKPELVWGTWEQFEEACKVRPQGYREAVLEHATDATDEGFNVPVCVLARLRLFYPRGIGDVVSGLLGAIGIHSAPGCGCDQRREKLNELLPLG